MFSNKRLFAVKRLSRRITATNRTRNLYVIIAIVLTTMLLTSVFSIGMSYLQSFRMQQMRLMGSIAHVVVTHPSEQQIQKLRTLPYVKTVGLQQNVGLIETTPEMKNMVLTLHWYDKTEWESLRIPADVDIVGTYPVKYNEIMIPLWILNNMGIDHPRLGMKIPLSFFLSDERGVSEKETFVLSGYCTEYTYIRSGNIGTMYVSEEFAQKSGKTVQSHGSASVEYRNYKNIMMYNEKLTKDLSLTNDQEIKTAPMYEASSSERSSTLTALSAIVLFLMFSGYLLIYNVFYISISKDIRFYGLLKIIGTSTKQIRKIVIRQALSLAVIGIPVGLFIGAILSFVIVPMAINLSDLKTGVEISFSPLIFIGAAFFTLLTTLIGAAKSVRIAVKITPVEALRFTGAHNRGKSKHSTSGGKTYRMAWRNMFRDRKRTFIVVLSLFLGILTFMILTTLISSMDTDNYVASYVKNDFILENNTLDVIGTASGKPVKQKFDEAFLEKLNKIDGITNLRTTTMEKMNMTYTPEQFSQHIDLFYKKFKVKTKLTEQQIQNNFWGYIFGIDSRYIEEFNRNSKKKIDINAFKQGDIALIGTDDPKIYADVKQMNVEIPSSGKSMKIALGGFVPFGFQYAGGCMAPNIYVSEETLAGLVAEPMIYKVNMDVEDDLEEQALDKIKLMTEGDYEISRTSKLEQQEAMSNTKLMMYLLGGGIALVLALIGILNFINVMITGIIARKLELAMLESIGMTKRQLRRMLVIEGFCYAGVTMFLIGTLGSMVNYGIFKLFQQQADYAVFSIPFLQMLVITIMVFVICMTAPQIAYRSLRHSSIVERLRETE